MGFPGGCNWPYPLFVSLKTEADVLSWILGLILFLTLDEEQSPNYERFQVNNRSLTNAKRFSGSPLPDWLWNLLMFNTKIQNMWINISISFPHPLWHDIWQTYSYAHFVWQKRREQIQYFISILWQWRYVIRLHVFRFLTWNKLNLVHSVYFRA